MRGQPASGHLRCHQHAERAKTMHILTGLVVVRSSSLADGPRGSDLWGSDRLGHAVKYGQPVSAALCRLRFVRKRREATLGTLPVVRDPDIAGRVDGNVSQRLHAATDITAGW